ncbi:MAG: hypothetical protein MMC23_004773 [Stictis urceolatum]|nr:hypothetical protein [Stictis urceolata]
MPRPDLAELSVGYRRIPILAIGKDLYCDSRLILQRLEQISGHGQKLGARTPEGLIIQRLLESWTIDGGVFWRAVQLIPFWTTPLAKDPRFIRDREELLSKSLSKEAMVKERPEALSQIRSAFQLIETSILADGRQWVLGTSRPTLADIHGIWPLQWLVGIDGALPEEYFSGKLFPKVYAWINRFWAAEKGARKFSGKARALDGAQAISAIMQGQLSKDNKEVDEEDPLELESGELVEVFINDLPPKDKDQGRVVSLNIDEVVIQNRKGLHLHFPRWGFSVKELSQPELK